MFFNRNSREIQSRKIEGEKLYNFLTNGYRQRYIFPHSVFYLPKPGPDGLKLAFRMCDCRDVSQLTQILIYAEEPVLKQFPDELFFDDDLMWHQQQFGRKGQIATATMVRKDGTLYCLAPHSDIVQRISRHREYKTRIEKAFKGWMHMLLNAVLNFASEQRVPSVHVPSSELALRYTDRKRVPGALLFRRIYDEYVHQLFTIHQRNEWWRIDLAENNDRITQLDRVVVRTPFNKNFSLCHTITEKNAQMNLEKMLAAEKRCGMKATYMINASLHDEYKHAIAANGHCISFYSCDCSDADNQLGQCRRVDYRIKGYSPFGFHRSAELTDFNLAFHNFEWLAGCDRTLKLKNGITRIPLHLNDSEVEWEQKALSGARRSNFTALVLSDQRAVRWLPRYESFLEKLSKVSATKTLDEISAELIFNHAL